MLRDGEAVDPEFVIFSAGSQHGHPRDATAQRDLNHGIALDSIFRTDRGVDEDGPLGPLEWKHLSVDGCQDKKGDDHVDVFIIEGAALSVTYVEAAPPTGC